MIKEIKIEVCDLCGKSSDEREIFNGVDVPTYRTFDSNDGTLHYSKKHYYNEKMDLCEECLEKISLVHSIGVQCNKYEYTGGNK